MYVSVSRLRVTDDKSDELIAAFRARAHLVDSHPGFIDLQVWKSDRDPDEILMITRWQDKDAFRDYMRSADHRISHDRMAPTLRRSIKLERLESLQTFEVVAQ